MSVLMVYPVKSLQICNPLSIGVANVDVTAFAQEVAQQRRMRPRDCSMDRRVAVLVLCVWRVTLDLDEMLDPVQVSLTRCGPEVALR